ncbi:MAG: EpsI family protein [Pyrinomonas sp.]|uniref:exosortase C-terminal domain/associated protein EpsI n=1 Tax=Pyrinomonas sp. TaxID=2080306 RepID=UPI0033224A96
MRKDARFWILVVALALSGAAIHLWERVGEAHVERAPLAEFPSEVGDWRQYGLDEKFDAETERVLGATDYLSRLYVSRDGQLASFYVGYYATQRTGKTYHSPLNCLPGSGWAMTEPARVLVRPPDAPPFEANRYIIQKGSDRQLLLYWYEGRGRSVASEYWGKIYTVLDSMRRRRSDGAMVRVIVPLRPGISEERALAIATDLAAKAYAHLPRFVPR